MRKLTPRQNQILEFLQDRYDAFGAAPTYREIATHFGFKSPKAAADHINALEKKGYVRRRGGRARGIELISSGKSPSSVTIHVPLLGHVSAGQAVLEAEHYQRSIAIDKEMLGRSAGHRLFAVQVTGESMEGRSIHDGDWVIADMDASPSVGDVVVALIDGKSTLKTLAAANGVFFLKAENPEYPDLMPLNEMVVQGVVRVVLRRMG